MKHNLFIWTLKASFIMLVIPFVILSLVPSDWAMIVNIVLLLFVNTIFSAYTGWISGKDVHILWELPLVLCVLFAIGYNVFIEMGLSATLYYCSVYAITAYISMLLSYKMRK